MKTTSVLTTLLAASALSVGAAVTTAGALDGDTAVTVGPAKPVAAGTVATFDAAGVRAIRRGKPIPAGYALVGRTVRVDAGTNAAGALVHLSCPADKTLRTLGEDGNPILQITRRYVGQRATNVYTLNRTGEDVSGTVYGVCR